MDRVNTVTVLIVEDEDSATPLEIALAALDGVKVMILANGQEAVDLLRLPSMQIAAVVTDLHLPHVDGYELVRTIRADTRYSHVPIVVVSGDSHPEVPERLRTLGADAFFPKPYSPAEIRKTLRGLLNAT
jgi:CheY-like chemotaxis protein